nr:TonB-dependent receptor [uncultured Carboxylicivirga sp.]
MFKLIYQNIARSMNKVLLCSILVLTSQLSWGQVQEALKGRVVDINGNPIEGAFISVAEEIRFVISDKDGYFELNKVKAGDDVHIELIGYDTVVLSADLNESQLVTLHEADLYAKELALPFHRQQKKYVVNSVSTMTGDELEKHPVTVLQNAFVGSLTGVATYEARSEPGWSETDIYIRGLRTMNESARAPLVIVDDVERDLSFLDAYPIETISVLKDAASTAIYGMRGANGVILVTTRRGEEGRLRIKLNQEIGFNTPSGIPMHQNSYNYAVTMNQARYLDGLSPLYSDQDIQHYKEAVEGTLDPSLRYKYISTNWYEEMMRETAPQNRTNLTISGGSKRTRYFVAFSYLNQEGLYDTRWTEWNDGYSTQHNLDRYNLRSNIDVDVTEGLNISLDLGGRIDKIRQPLASTWELFTWGTGELLPTNPVFTPRGDFFLPTDNDVKNGPARVAMSGINYNRRRNLYTNLRVNGDLSSITEGLSIEGLIGFDSYNRFKYEQSQNFNGFYYDFDSGIAEDPDSYTYTRRSYASALSNPVTTPAEMSYNINVIGALKYDRTFGKHNVNGQAMMRTYQNIVEGFNSSYRFLTFGGIGNYIYDGKYIAQVTASYMGSDNYAPNERFGFFPGASVGWLLSEEGFLKNDNIDLLKLRASIGRAGQSNTGVRRYPYQGEYSQGNGYNFGTSQSYYQGTYESAAGNSNIKWELSDMVNIGVDYDFWNRGLYGQVDLFKEWRSNILVSRSTVPDMFGVTVPQDSYGKAETEGFELTMGHSGKIGSFRYFAEGMLTYNKSKITEMDEIEQDYDYQYRTGQSIGVRAMYIRDKWASDESLISTSHQDAIDNPHKYPYQGSMKLGNAVFVDQNGDGIIDADDMVYNGYSNIPELIPSIKLGVAWKGFDARVLLTAYLNRTVETRENMDYGFGWGGASTHEVTKTWGYYTDDPNDPRNINAQYPRLSTSFSDNDRNYPRNTSDIWLVCGNFLSLRNVEFGYTIPKSLTSKANISECRIYFSGYNLYNWSNFDNGFDPENPLNYIWAYPKTKSFSIGLNLAF